MVTVRLDVAVQAKTPALSRSFAQKLIKQGKVAVNSGVIKRVSYKVAPDDKLIIDYNQEKIPEIKLPIIYEDDDCVVINKPAGILSHSKGGYNPEPTVATWLQNRADSDEQSAQIGRFKSRESITVSHDRDGIVHRLDRATSGVMICAKNPDSQLFLQKQFSARRVVKKYMSLIENSLEPASALIDIPIARNVKDPKRFKVSKYGKPAQTMYKTVKTFIYKGKTFSLVELTPKTGRTHQLRVHLKYLGKPIVGDDFYGGLPAERLYLHAVELAITTLGGDRKLFKSPLPDDFLKTKINF